MPTVGGPAFAPGRGGAIAGGFGIAPGPGGITTVGDAGGGVEPGLCSAVLLGPMVGGAAETGGGCGGGAATGGGIEGGFGGGAGAFSADFGAAGIAGGMAGGFADGAGGGGIVFGPLDGAPPIEPMAGIGIVAVIGAAPDSSVCLIFTPRFPRCCFITPTARWISKT